MGLASRRHARVSRNQERLVASTMTRVRTQNDSLDLQRPGTSRQQEGQGSSPFDLGGRYHDHFARRPTTYGGARNGEKGAGPSSLPPESRGVDCSRSVYRCLGATAAQFARTRWGELGHKSHGPCSCPRRHDCSFGAGLLSGFPDARGLRRAPKTREAVTDRNAGDLPLDIAPLLRAGLVEHRDPH